MRRLLVVGLAIAALALAGCASRVRTPPKPPAPLKVRVSAESRTATDKADIQHLLDVPREWDAKAKVWRPLAKVTLLPDTAAARKAFPGALFPRETLGRKLIAISYLDGPRMSPNKVLTLVYEGRLRVVELRAPMGWDSPRGLDIVRVGAKVGTQTAVVETFPLGEDRVPHTNVKWFVGQMEFSVGGDSVSKEQLLRMARSMAP